MPVLETRYRRTDIVRINTDKFHATPIRSFPRRYHRNISPERTSFLTTTVKINFPRCESCDAKREETDAISFLQSGENSVSYGISFLARFAHTRDTRGCERSRAGRNCARIFRSRSRKKRNTRRVIRARTTSHGTTSNGSTFATYRPAACLLKRGCLLRKSSENSSNSRSDKTRVF